MALIPPGVSKDDAGNQGCCDQDESEEDTSHKGVRDRDWSKEDASDF
jgi:hypothetical protein